MGWICCNLRQNPVFFRAVVAKVLQIFKSANPLCRNGLADFIATDCLCLSFSLDGKGAMLQICNN